MSADVPNQTTPQPQVQGQQTQADTNLDSRFVSLTKKERDLQQKMEMFKKEQSNMVPKNDLSTYWKSDRAKLRELLGASEDEIPDVNPMNSEFKSLKDEIDNLKREKEQEVRDRELSSAKNNIKSFLDQDKEAYELIHAFEGSDMVFDYMLDHFKETQESLDFKTASDRVEEYLLGQLKRASSSKKALSLFPTKSEQTGKMLPPTLTGSSVSAPTAGTPRKLDPEASKLEAAKHLKWT